MSGPIATSCRWVCSIALVTLMPGGHAVAADSMDPPPGDYAIVDGKVDRGTYTGWALFHSACHGCHGKDALGTDIAPNLVEHIRSMTPRLFAIRVLTNYRLLAPSERSLPAQSDSTEDESLEMILRRERQPGSLIEMPAWKTDPLVSPHILDLFAYLSARASGDLKPGEPRVAK